MSVLNLRYPMLFIAAFALGILSTLLVIDYLLVEEVPVPTTFTTYVVDPSTNALEQESASSDDVDTSLMELIGISNKEQASPHNWIQQHQIKVTKQGVEIDLENAQWATFTDTNSMDPVIDENSHAIEIIPDSPQDIHVGDIVSYQSLYASGTTIHRVIEIGFDNNGWYCRMKGDNNTRTDPGKIRFDQIKRVLVAIIY